MAGISHVQPLPRVPGTLFRHLISPHYTLLANQIASQRVPGTKFGLFRGRIRPKKGAWHLLSGTFRLPEGAWHQIRPLSRANSPKKGCLAPFVGHLLSGLAGIASNLSFISSINTKQAHFGARHHHRPPQKRRTQHKATNKDNFHLLQKLACDLSPGTC